MLLLPLVLALDADGENRPPPPRGGFRTALWAIAAIICLAIAFFAASFFRGREHDALEELGKAREQLREEAISADRLNEAKAILASPNTLVVSFGKAQPQMPRGNIFVNSSAGILLLASGLPLAPAGKAYEMWLAPKRGMAIAEGLFQPAAAGGTTLYVREGPVDLSVMDAVSVTLENERGAAGPTTPPVIRAGISRPQ